MNRTWKPIAAGTLDLVGGSPQLLTSLIIVISAMMNRRGSDELAFYYMAILIFAPLAVTGTIAILGGVFALKREKFGLALIGSLMAWAPYLPLFLSFDSEVFEEYRVLTSTFTALLAIAIITMTVLSKKQFEK